jgi:hypothetical protein
MIYINVDWMGKEISLTFDAHVWFGDDDMFFGHSICVSGSLTERLSDAGIHG